METDRDDLRTRLTDSETEGVRLRQENIKLKAELDSLRVEKDRLVEKESELVTLRKEHQDVLKDVKVLRTDLDVHSHKANSARQEVDRLRSFIPAHGTDLRRELKSRGIDSVCVPHYNTLRS